MTNNDQSNNKKRKVSEDRDTKTTDIEPLKYDCPVPHCERKYKREISMLTHILTDHREFYNKLMDIVEDKESVEQICRTIRGSQPETNGIVHPTSTSTRSTGTQTTSEQPTSMSMAVVVRRDNNPNRDIPSTSMNGAFMNATNSNILKQIKESPCYHLQVNETLDIRNCSFMIVTVRYKFKNVIQEDVLCTKNNISNISAADILHGIFDIITAAGLGINKWVGISLDGVRAESITLADIMTLITERGLNIKLTYHFTRRAEYIAHHLSADLCLVLNEALDYINHRKTTEPDLFTAGMDNVAKEIFLRTDRYWLSYGNVLTQLFEMREGFDGNMRDKDWLCSLAFLADIFQHFDRFYQQMLAHDSSIFQIYSEFETMIDTLKMMKDQFGWHAPVSSYQNLQQFLAEPSIQINPSVMLGIQTSLKNLSNYLHRYLPVTESDIQTCEWIINPFKFNVYNVPADLAANAEEYAELMSLRKNLQKKFSYDYQRLETFWIEIYESYPNISKRAMQYLLTFKHARLSEAAFFKFVVANNATTL